MADVSLLDATRCRIVGWQVASEIAVETVLRALDMARLRRGAFHGGLSVSLDRAHFDAGREDRASARPRAWQSSAGFPPSGNRESDDTARRRA
jgi:transposase InsO family protein